MVQQHGIPAIDSTEPWAVELRQKVGESRVGMFEVCYNIEDDENP